jgi:hypothetical protein
MSRPSVRIAIALLVVAVVAACGFQLVSLERSLAAERQRTETLNQLAQSAAVELGNLRASQQAYVAAGQGGAFWGAKVDEALSALRSHLESLGRIATTKTAAEALAGARGTLEGFQQVDQRAREQAENGQLLMASDLVFTDGLESLTNAGRQIDTARKAQITENMAAGAGLEQVRIYTAAAAAGVVLLGLIVLVPIRRTEAIVTAPAEDQAPADLDLSEADIPPPPVRVSEAVAPPPLPIATQDAASALTLRQIAELCSDVARVVEPGELPGLLERASRLLDASGVILWIADRPGAELRPVIAHGYSAAMLARMPSIGRDGDNATAAAYREARLEVVRTDGRANGAVVAPLITADGCVGVMAAEVKHGAECKAALQSLARILAAQFAALVSPAPATVESAAPRELTTSRS